MRVDWNPGSEGECEGADCGLSPERFEEENQANDQTGLSTGDRVLRSAVEQLQQGTRPRAALIASFDGLGFGFTGPQGTASLRNPSDNSLAVGPNHIVQIVNSRMAVFTKRGSKFPKTGEVLYGPVVTNKIFADFGGQCEQRVSGDAVVRYDQLADRWLYVLPIFKRPPDDPKGPYSMCYAVSVGSDPLGPYHRYEFKRPLFPDYPRPAIWPDGYYIPTSTGDTVIQKHVCVADRTKMLAGEAAIEQCVIVDGVNFLNNADLDGQRLPPAGTPNIVMAAGGTQLHNKLSDDVIYVWQFHVDWNTPANTKLSEPAAVKVAPYSYLCGGQLTKCVSQPGTETHLDAQGDKIMQRVVYRNFGDREAIVAVHSVNTSTAGGGVRWYEFRLDKARKVTLYQQGTYAPDGFYRWMGSIGLDKKGGIGIGYSFGGAPNFAGQRFAARLANDPLGELPLHETTLAEGHASQTNTLRWEDYTTTAMDPSDDCTFWYVGDYLKEKSTSYSTRIGGFRLPGCLTAKVSGTVFFDRNHDGRLSVGETGLGGYKLSINGGSAMHATSDANGKFFFDLNADTANGNTNYSLTPEAGKGKRLETKPANVADSEVKTTASSYELALKDGYDIPALDFAAVCIINSKNFRDPQYWETKRAKTILESHESDWTALFGEKLYLVGADGSRFVPAHFNALHDWLKDSSSGNDAQKLSAQVAAAALTIVYLGQSGEATMIDPVTGDWPSLNVLINRASTAISEKHSEHEQKYLAVFERLNGNRAQITPSDPAGCGRIRRSE